MTKYFLVVAVVQAMAMTAIQVPEVLPEELFSLIHTDLLEERGLLLAMAITVSMHLEMPH
jgi:hypothetical protein